MSDDLGRGKRKRKLPSRFDENEASTTAAKEKTAAAAPKTRGRKSKREPSPELENNG